MLISQGPSLTSSGPSRSSMFSSTSTAIMTATAIARTQRSLAPMGHRATIDGPAQLPALFRLPLILIRRVGARITSIDRSTSTGATTLGTMGPRRFGIDPPSLEELAPDLRGELFPSNCTHTEQQGAKISSGFSQLIQTARIDCGPS